MRSRVLYELRIRGINPKQPGYEMLIVSIEATVMSGKSLTKKEILYNLHKSKLVIPRVKIETNREPEYQWMVEALRCIGYKKSVRTFINEIAVIVINELTKDITRDVMKLTGLFNLAAITN